MKKTGSVFIKNLRYLCLIGIIALGLMTIVGTGGGGGDGGGTTTPTPPPTVPDFVADAGPDRTGAKAQDMNNPGTAEIVFLNASASSGSEWAWSVTSGSGNYKFTSSNTQITGFYGDKAGEYTLELQVGNGAGKTATDTVTVKLINDIDFDGVPDNQDLDRDGDGFLNAYDAFPDDKASHYDEDSDGTGNYYTSDVDGDGVDDIEDDFPLDQTKTTYETYSEATETGASNQNDGIGVSEDAGAVPKKIKGYIYADSNKPDIDYYKLAFSTSGRYSVVVAGAISTMSPTIAVMEAGGSSVPTTTANMPLEAGSTAISILISSAGDYYLSITDSSGTSDSTWAYTVKLFPDEDLDGIPDDLEKAIDSNHLTADSDGDGISDYVEIHQAITDWSVYKDGDSDGLPCWWDLDSDEDLVPDAIEYYSKDERPDLSAGDLAQLNDADGDKILNFLDSDSDGNGITDETEAGLNPTEPLDTDLDNTPDYLDLDDDGDGLLDVNEQSGYRLAALEPAEDMQLSNLMNSTLGADHVARAADDVLLEGSDLPTTASDTWIIIRGTKGILNLNPSTIDSDGLHLSWPSEISSGLVEVFVAYNNKYTNSLDILIPDGNAPILTGYSVDASSGQVTFTGVNLNATLTVNFTGESATVYNSSGSATSFTVSIPSGAQRGTAYVNSSAGDSNTIWVDLARALPGRIELPSGSTVDVTTLDVSWSPHPDDEINPDSSGNFTTTADISGPTVVTALIEDTTSTDPKYAVFLEGLALKGDTFITLNSQSTALALTWDSIGVQGLVSESSLSGARDLLEGLQEVKDLGTLLESKLATNPYVLGESDTDIQTKAKAAILAAATAVQDALADGALTALKSLKIFRSIQGMFGPDAEVTPSGIVDGIQVYERDDTGNINIYNDTQLYLSAKITASDGAVLQSHITGVRGMAGPQGYGLLQWASINTYKQPNGKNCIVQVVTPGIDREYDPKVSAPRDVAEWLVIRTVVERVLWPPISSVISVKINPGDLANIIMDKAPSMPAIMDDFFVQGNVSNGIKGLLTALYQDITSVPPGSITKAIAARYGKGLVEKALAKIAAKIAAKLVPVLGQISAAYDVAGHLNNGVNAAGAVYDLVYTDSMIEYDVKFPLEIKEVVPSKVRCDEKDKTFLIKGSGFSKIVRGLVWTQTLTPIVTFIDADGNEYPVEPHYINSNGTMMTVTVAGWWFDKYTKGPIKVTVHHPKDDPNTIAEKDPAVSIVTEVEISSISPEKGGEGTAATIYGAGFSNIISDNEVMFGSKIALISKATETSLNIVIPNGLDPGEYEVKARSRFDGTWSDWSNTVTFEVVEGEVKITVSDWGGLKDDAFALYVDGKYIGTMYASPSDYSDTYSMSLSVGTHTAMLLGVEAPDNVGTYGISFQGVENVTGDPLSGTDLVPGVKKYYTFTVPSVAAKAVRKITAFPYTPNVPGPEALRMLREE
jgi:hypothetical protein